MTDDTEMMVSPGITRTILKLPDCRHKGLIVLIIVVVSVVLNLALITTVGVISHSKASHKHSTCDSVACVGTAGAVASNLNKSHPACSDFYEYSCGGYKLHHNVEEGTFGTTVWTELVDTHSKRMRMSIESVDQHQKYGKEVYALFRSCMDLVALNATNAKPLLDIINVGGALQWPILAGDAWTDKFDMTTYMKTLHHMNINSFFTLTKGPNPLRPSKVALKVIPSGLNMYQWYYTSDSPFVQQRQEEFRKRLIDLAVKLGANTTVAERDIEDAFNFEMKLAKIMPDLPTTHEASYTARQLKLRALYKNYVPITKFDWKVYIAAMFPSKMTPKDTTTVFVENNEFFDRLASVLSVTSDRTLANYLGMSMVYVMADHLPEHIGGQISSHKRFDYDTSPLYYQCASVTEKLMPWAALRSMLDKQLIADKTPAKEIFANMKTALIENLNKVSDKFSKKFATQLKDRVLHLHEKLGYPDWLLKQDLVNQFYENMTVTLDRATYFQNVVDMTKFRKTNILMSTEEQYEDGEGWDYHFSDTQGTYALHGNDIQIPSSYMFSPVYSEDMPPAFNYGGMGAWTAWYMAYALEDDWHKYYTDGGKVIPIEPTEEDAKAFQTAKDCYNYVENKTYVPPGYTKPGIQIGGTFGIEYLHFDMVATNIAYNAYKQTSSDNEFAPALPQNKDQLFFLALGQFYCSTNYSPLSYYHKLLNGIAASREEFTKAFGCQDDDPLYNDGSTKCYL